MKGYSKWSYSPYKPPLFFTGDIYICRVVPYEHKIHLEWLLNGNSYTIFVKKCIENNFYLAGETDKNFFDIENLDENTDYIFYVQSGTLKSRTRLARTGKSVGICVNYLHPDDDVYSFSGRALCSPSLVRHPDGYLLASMDVFKGKYPQNLTLIFRSDDEGKNWHYVSELMPCFWGKLFVYDNVLYMLSVSTEYGDLLIGKSTDGGKTFSSPVALLRGSNGKNGESGIHKNPQPLIIYKGRIYETLEWGSWSNNDFYHASMVMSCDLNDDFMVPENWSFTEPLKYNPSWEGVVEGPCKSTLEGCLTVLPDGKLYNIMRYAISETAIPPYGLVLAFEVDTLHPEAPLKYSHSIKLPGNNSKFMIKFDYVSKKYYTIISRIDSIGNIHARNLLSLMVSDDCENWIIAKDLIDMREFDKSKIGFQYVDFIFDGDDIIFLSRTAINGAFNYHDTNYQTFHRIENFRNL